MEGQFKRNDGSCSEQQSSCEESVRDKRAANGLGCHGVSPVCIGDASTVVLTHHLKRHLSELHCGNLGSTYLIWLRGIQTRKNNTVFSIESLASSETCGLNSLSPELRCHLCKNCLILSRFRVKQGGSSTGFAFAAPACLAKLVQEDKGPSANHRALIAFPLRASNSTSAVQLCQFEEAKYDSLICEYMNKLRDAVGNELDVPISSECHDEFPQSLLIMLECISKETSNFTYEEFVSLHHIADSTGGRKLYAGYLDQLDTAIDNAKTTRAVVAVSFDGEYDFCLYEFNFNCSLNYL
ncbi:hypothetical protein BgAZ_402530 [Babesia gibsoni]|uniref:Uncharacterized protein n=1 Tax=Babesia gibsoni TaxID=33632 RepID=A0AAD8LMN7_BABGI|nr:hypothetical protein BgAZ_402530 [Babesia gibsoni]